jgi:hypothetical protein
MAVTRCCEHRRDDAGRIVQCTGTVTDAVRQSGTMGCQVMCDRCWMAYYTDRLSYSTWWAKQSSPMPTTVEGMIPVAVAWCDDTMQGAAGYGEDVGDDVRQHTQALFAG